MKRKVRFGITLLLTGCLLAGSAMPAAASSQAAPGQGAAAARIRERVPVIGGAVTTATVKTQTAGISGFHHIKRRAAAVKFGWDPVDGASLYVLNWKIFDRKGKEKSKDSSHDFTRNPAFTISGIPKGGFAIVDIAAVDENQSVLAQKSFFAIPVFPAVKKTESAWRNGKMYVIAYSNSAADKYEIECMTLTGKKLQKKTAAPGTTGEFAAARFSKVKRNAPFKVRITPKVSDPYSGGESLAGKSRTFICVPQPQIASTKKDVKPDSVMIRWKKVKKAKCYTIYACVSSKAPKNINASKLKYQKIKTVSAGKTGYRLTNIKGQKLNIRKKYCYFKVVTTAKIGKQKVKSSDLEFFYATVV